VTGTDGRPPLAVPWSERRRSHATREAPPVPTPLAELADVARVYDGGRVVALRGVSLCVARGESLAVVGPSGSGKSTLLHLLGGLEAPSGGHVLFEGLEPRGPRAWARLRARRIGFVFQAYHLLPALTAWENVQVPMLGVVAGAARRAGRAQELLERLGLGRRLHHRPAALSGGERQRVAIARSLANDPDLVLADEPTGNLDSAASADILDLLVEVRAERGVALVLVTHDAAAAARAERVVRLVDGAVVGEAAR
jgi:predicted ABC-type transport system involved in lysophospholipase L1 biosynthesis ATPase subunit